MSPWTTRGRNCHRVRGEHGTPVCEQIGGTLPVAAARSSSAFLRRRICSKSRGQVGFVNNVFGHHVQGRDVFGDDGCQGRAVRCNFAPAQLGELVHVVDGAGMCVYTTIATRVGYGAGDGGYGEGQSARGRG